MTALQTLLNSPFIYRLGLTLLHSLWEGAAVMAILSLAMLMLRKSPPQARYAAASLAMVLLIALPMVTFFVVDFPHDAVSSDRKTTTINAVPAENASSTTSLNAASQNDVTATEQSFNANSSTHPDFPVAPLRTAYFAALPWIAVAWFTGVAIVAIWNFGGWIALQQLRFSTTFPAGEEAGRITRTLSRRLGIVRSVRVLKSTFARTPMVIGALKPVILLPASALTELSIAELESIIAHELAHIRRHDFVINLLQAIIETILFYHPAVWLVSSRIRQERENCCDDLALSVTRDRACYVRALAAVASVRVTSLVPAASGGRLLPRLQRLLGVADASTTRPSRWTAGVVVLTLLISAALFTRSRAQVAPNNADAAKDSDDIVWIHGHVIDPQGRPISNAAIAITAYPFTSPITQATSDADGSYKISFRKSSFDESGDSWRSTVVAATAPGFGPGWANWDHTAAGGDVVLKLATDDVPIEGRILDVEGRPVGGVKVVVTTIHPNVIDLNKLDIDRSDPSEEFAAEPPNLDGLVLGAAQYATTAADGKFRFAGLGRDREIEMIASGGGIAQSYMQANTRPGPAQSKSFQAYIKMTETTYGSTFDFIAAPGRVIRGTVRDASTHEPLAGVAIRTQKVRLGAVTDAQGHYQMEGFRVSERELLTAVPSESQPYLMRDADVTLTPGKEPFTLDFDLHRGVPITGKVTDKTTGMPVNGMEIVYFPYLTNTVAQALPEFIKGEVPTRFGRCYTHADGTFHTIGLPGQGVLAARNSRGGGRPFRKGVGADTLKVPLLKNETMRAFGGRSWRPKDFIAVKDVEIADGQAQAALDLQCDPGITVHVKLIDSKGAPVTDAIALNSSPGKYVEKAPTGTFDVIALAPDETRYFTIIHAGRKLGKILEFKTADAPSRNIEVTLEPWSFATGRLVGVDGQPMADAMLLGPIFQQFPAGTDTNGHFKLRVLQGLTYHIQGIKGRDNFDTDVMKLALKPGETKDLGDVHVKPYN